MPADSSELTRVSKLVFAASGFAWLLMLGPTGLSMTHCPMQESGALAPVDALQMFLAMNSLGPLCVGWAVMLAAMMLPLLTTPIAHVRYSSFRHRRNRATALLLLGYCGIWMLAGAVLLPLAAVAGMSVPGSSWWIAALAALAITVVWQASPARQICINRAHNHRALAAFGFAADLDAFRFGLEHGFWCAGSCWGLMLLPMLLPSGHVAAMIVAAVLMFCERLEPAAPPAWRFHGIAPLRRILLTRMRRWLHRPVPMRPPPPPFAPEMRP